MEKSGSLIDVVLYLRGQSLDPALVTSMLGADGSKMLAKGDTWTTSGNREVTAKTGLWTLDAGAQSNSLSDHIAWLRDRLAAAKCAPLDIPGVEKAEVSVFIGLSSNEKGDGDCYAELTEDDMAWLGRIGAMLSFRMFHETNAPYPQGSAARQ